MPDSLLTAALAEAYASAPTDVVVLPTLELAHASFTEPVRLVCDHADLTAGLEDGAVATFLAFAFELNLPEVNAQGSPEVTIAVDNASAEIARLLDAIADSADPLEVAVRMYRSDQLAAPAGRAIRGEVRHISIDAGRVTFRVGFVPVANKPFPAELYTPARFPGLVR